MPAPGAGFRIKSSRSSEDAGALARRRSISLAGSRTLTEPTHRTAKASPNPWWPTHPTSGDLFARRRSGTATDRLVPLHNAVGGGGGPASSGRLAR
jgi:hypothetical protein